MKQIDFFKIVALEEKGGLCPHTSTKWQTGDGFALGVCQLKDSEARAPLKVVDTLTDYCLKEDWEQCPLNKGER